MNVAVILAGGVGNRVGAGIPKQFIEIFGKPILAYTIDPFEKHSDVDAILVVCVKPYIDYVWELKEKYGFSKLFWITEGGSTFQESMMKGVRFLSDKVRREDTVLFHFGASPYISDDIITDVIKVCKEKGTNAISTTDYYLLSGEKKTTASVTDPNNYTDKYINRETIAVMNTPHAFQYGYILDLYKEAVETGIINTVEPHTTTLMYAMGKKIYFSKGSQNNIKITTKEDLDLFEGYVLKQLRNSIETVSGEVVVFFDDGFEECEGLLVVDILRRAEIKVVMASVTGRRDVKSSRDVMIHTDCLAENVDYENAKMIVLPGGSIDKNNLQNSTIVKDMCIEFAKDKYIGAVGSAPVILSNLGLMRKATVHPDFKEEMKDVNVLDELVVIDKNIITGQGLGSSIIFALELVKILLGEDIVKKIKNDIYYRE